RNFDVELRRAQEKLENGMSGFLTQPVLSAQAVENLKKTREALVETDDAFLRKLNAGQKVIAIELDSPKDADLTGYLEGARRLQA
ncbi:hypothetical protein ACSTB0_13485, partial [Faecalibacterium wellingii]